MEQADKCKTANVDEYEKTLGELYGEREVETRQAYSRLMKAPFKAYVTTNFDPLLSEAADVEGYLDVRYYPDLPSPDIERCEKALFYIHGHARPKGKPNGHNLILSRSEFKQAYGTTGVVRLFVQHLLLNYSIVFLGCGLLEPDIHQQIQCVHEMHVQVKAARDGFVPPLRFALSQTIVSEATGTRDLDAEARETDRFRALDTEVLRYDPVDRRKHWEIEDILKNLCELTSKVSESGPGEERPR